MKDDEKYYLLLDEVQFMPRFEEVLNSLLRIKNIDIYVTGSNSRFLSSDIVTEFRGRGNEIRIYPLSFAEFYSVYDGEYEDALDDYMVYGGLPQVAGFQSERQKADYLKNIFANVYLKDVIERNKIQNADEIGILVDVLASSFGSPTNPTRIANTFASTRQMTYTNKCPSELQTAGTVFSVISSSTTSMFSKQSKLSPRESTRWQYVSPSLSLRYLTGSMCPYSLLPNPHSTHNIICP